MGINGKPWRLLKNWYEGVSGYVMVDGESSEKFGVERGVRQGSVLSPSLFLLVMDPLLRQSGRSQVWVYPSIISTWEASFMLINSRNVTRQIFLDQFACLSSQDYLDNGNTTGAMRMHISAHILGPNAHAY